MIRRDSDTPGTRPGRLSELLKWKSPQIIPDVRFAKLSPTELNVDISVAWIGDKEHPDREVLESLNHAGVPYQPDSTAEMLRLSFFIPPKEGLKRTVSKTKTLHSSTPSAISRNSEIQAQRTSKESKDAGDKCFTVNAANDVAILPTGSVTDFTYEADVSGAFDHNPSTDAGFETMSHVEQNSFVEEFEEDVKTKWRGMHKNHYVDKTSRKNCNGCNKQFKMKRRPFHCRRCGEVFCLDCLKYKRKLNKLANPDPQGKMRKVCRGCFEDDQFVFGQTKSLTVDFKDMRQHARYARVLTQRVNSLTTTFWRDQLDIRKECKRLLCGFHDRTKMSETRNVLLEITAAIKTPEWQKSPYWELEVQSGECRKCKRHKVLRKSAGSCRVCGVAMCKRCTTKDLLLFYEDGSDHNSPRLAIINEQGSPKKEPDISLHLSVCTDCREYIVKEQRLDVTWYTDPTPTSPMEIFVAMDTSFSSLADVIETVVTLLREATVNDTKESFTESQKRKITPKITTLQVKLDEFERQCTTLRKLLPQMKTKPQHRLLQNYIKSKHEFFMEHKHTYRKLKNRVS